MVWDVRLELLTKEVAYSICTIETSYDLLNVLDHPSETSLQLTVRLVDVEF